MHTIKRSHIFVQRGARAASSKVTVGLRREDLARTWERRTPLTPDAVEELVEDMGAEVLVEECERRVYRTRDYEKVSFLTLSRAGADDRLGWRANRPGWETRSRACKYHPGDQRSPARRMHYYTHTHRRTPHASDV